MAIIEYGTICSDDERYETELTDAELAKTTEFGYFGGLVSLGGTPEKPDIGFRFYSISAQYAPYVVEKDDPKYRSNVINAIKIVYKRDDVNWIREFLFGTEMKNLLWESIEFSQEEYCKRITISKVFNKKSNYTLIRSIELVTNSGRTFSVGKAEKDHEHEVIDVLEFDGKIIDIDVESGEAIDRLKFKVEQKPYLIETFNYVYDTQSKKLTESDDIVYLQEFRNLYKNPSSISFQGSRMLQSTFMWNFITKLGLSCKVTAETGVPFFAKGEVEIGMTIDFEMGVGGIKTEEHSYSWQVDFILDPGYTMNAEVRDRYGKLDLPYKCNAVAYYRGGSFKKGHLKGIFKNASKHELYVTLSDGIMQSTQSDVKKKEPKFVPHPYRVLK